MIQSMDKKGKVNNNNKKQQQQIKKQTNKQSKKIKKQQNRYPLPNDPSIITTKRTQNSNKPWKAYKTA